MFKEFKTKCVTSNERLLNAEIIKQETPTSETPYELWVQNPDDYESKHDIDEDNHLFEIVDVPSNDVLKMEKSSGKKTKRDVCSYCGKTFLFLSQHIKSMHSGTLSNTRKFACMLCFESFTERYCD